MSTGDDDVTLHVTDHIETSAWPAMVSFPLTYNRVLHLQLVSVGDYTPCGVDVVLAAPVTTEHTRMAGVDQLPLYLK